MRTVASRSTCFSLVGPAQGTFDNVVGLSHHLKHRWPSLKLSENFAGARWLAPGVAGAEPRPPAAKWVQGKSLERRHSITPQARTDGRRAVCRRTTSVTCKPPEQWQRRGREIEKSRKPFELPKCVLQCVQCRRVWNHSSFSQNVPRKRVEQAQVVVDRACEQTVLCESEPRTVLCLSAGDRISGEDQRIGVGTRHVAFSPGIQGILKEVQKYLDRYLATSAVCYFVLKTLVFQVLPNLRRFFWVASLTVSRTSHPCPRPFCTVLQVKPTQL